MSKRADAVAREAQWQAYNRQLVGVSVRTISDLQISIGWILNNASFDSGEGPFPNPTDFFIDLAERSLDTLIQAVQQAPIRPPEL